MCLHDPAPNAQTAPIFGSQAFKVMQLAFNHQNGGQYLGGLLCGKNVGFLVCLISISTWVRFPLPPLWLGGGTVYTVGLNPAADNGLWVRIPPELLVVS